MKEPKLSALVETVAVLQRMMRGERLRLKDLVRPSGPSRTTLRRRMRRLVDGLEHAHRSEPGPGRAEEFWWTWPSEEATSPEQVWALAASRAMLHTFREGEIGRVLSDLMRDHLRRLPSAAPGAVDRMFFASARLVNPIALEIDVVDRLATAISGQHIIKATYLPFSGEKLPVKIQPWTLLFADEGVYLYGLCLDSPRVSHLQQRRIYNVIRFSGLRVLSERFPYPLQDDYDPAQEFKHCFGVFQAPEGSQPCRVVLRFVNSWAPYLSCHRLHPTQQREPTICLDGRIEVEMTLHITYDLVRWIRGQGLDVDVVEPQGLADWVLSRKGLMARGEFIRASTTSK